MTLEFPNLFDPIPNSTHPAAPAINTPTHNNTASHHNLPLPPLTAAASPTSAFPPAFPSASSLLAAIIEPAPSASTFTTHDAPAAHPQYNHPHGDFLSQLYGAPLNVTQTQVPVPVPAPAPAPVHSQPHHSHHTAHQPQQHYHHYQHHHAQPTASVATAHSQDPHAAAAPHQFSLAHVNSTAGQHHASSVESEATQLTERSVTPCPTPPLSSSSGSGTVAPNTSTTTTTTTTTASTATNTVVSHDHLDTIPHKVQQAYIHGLNEDRSHVYPSNTTTNNNNNNNPNLTTSMYFDNDTQQHQHQHHHHQQSQYNITSSSSAVPQQQLPQQSSIIHHHTEPASTVAVMNDQATKRRKSRPVLGVTNGQNGKITKRGRRISSNSTLPCPVCEQTYSRKDNLRAHMRIHSGERPYKCSKCTSSFRWLGALRKHLASVHNERHHSNASANNHKSKAPQLQQQQQHADVHQPHSVSPQQTTSSNMSHMTHVNSHDTHNNHAVTGNLDKTSEHILTDYQIGEPWTLPELSPNLLYVAPSS